MVLEKNPKTRPLVKRLLELEDRISGLPFPKMKRVKQIDSNSCGPAVIATLYSCFGIKVSQNGIISSLRVKNKIKKFGLSVKDLTRASRIVGKGAFTFWKKSNAKVGDLVAIINKYKHPVAVEWQGVFYENEDGDNGHYSVVTKIDKRTDTLRISDPYSEFAGVDRKFEIRTFKERWWDENVVKGKTIVDRRVMFLITPKSESKEIGDGESFLI